MNELLFINDASLLADYFKEIKLLRISKKQKEKRKFILSKADKILILEKTNYKCHICGGVVELTAFEADHVEVNSSSTNNKIDNFLPACRTCNNYRWFYEPDEIKWILKLGVWLKTEITRGSVTGKLAAQKFIQHEIKRHARRKSSFTTTSPK